MFYNKFLRTVWVCVLFLVAGYATADGYIFNCELKAVSTKGWIPNNLVLSFRNDGAQAEIIYGHKSDNVRVEKFGYGEKRVFALIPMTEQGGATFGTQHRITISKNSIVDYDFRSNGRGTHYKATGTCRLKQIKSKVIASTAQPKKIYAGNTCSTNPRKCNEKELCSYASYVAGGMVKWKTSASAVSYVSESKRRGLFCRATKKIAKSKAASYVTGFAQCSANLEMCRDASVCRYATITRGEYTKWHTDSKKAGFIREARSRGLTCGVNTTANNSGSASAVSKVNSSNKTQVKAMQVQSSASNQVEQYRVQKQACKNIGFVAGTTEFASCVLQLLTKQNTSTVQKSSPSYSNVIRICEAEAGAGAASTYRPTTSSSSTYRSECTSWNNSLNCNTTGGSSYDGGLSNLGHTLSKNANKNRLFDACVLKYGYEPPKRKTLLQKLFGTN
jgi:hypothetical protein